MKTDLSKFQQVLEAIQTAQTMGVLAILDDKTNAENEDQDCYPRGLVISLDRKDPKWHALRFLSKHLDWVSMDTKTKHLYIQPPKSTLMQYRNTEVRFLHAVADSLCENGIESAPDVYFR